MSFQLLDYRFTCLLFVIAALVATNGPTSTEIASLVEPGFVSFMQHNVKLNHQQHSDATGFGHKMTVDLVQEMNEQVLSAEASIGLHVERFWREMTTQRAVPAHPFPSWGWEDVKTTPLVICSIVLFFGAVLCSAGGIGGGGIYVTVLMVAGAMNPYDAVPLSKAVVFFGALVSLFLNMRKAFAMQEEQKKETLIDYNVCRLVVPCSLLGTLIGVMVNSLIPSPMIVAMLCLILCAMTYMSFQKFIRKHMEESLAACEEAVKHQNPQEALATGSSGATDALSQEKPSMDKNLLGPTSQKDATAGYIRSILLPGEGTAATLLLLLVIACGVFRQHAENCKGAIIDTSNLANEVHEECVRPVMKIFFGGSLTTWMAQPTLAQWLPLLSLLIPALICLAVACGYGRLLIKHEEGWNMGAAIGYSGMALFTGCFAGLVGIGGGLVFSPFFLWMGMHPPIAVATSSTCVIFTSSSTTMQYLFTDRIILSLALTYGIVSSIAAYIGTSAVHYLQDKMQTRESYISGVVALGVLASVVLSIYKLFAVGFPDH